MFNTVRKHWMQLTCHHDLRFMFNVMEAAEIKYYGKRCSVWVCNHCHKTIYDVRIYQRDLKGRVIKDDDDEHV